MALFMSYIISFKRSICPFYIETDDMTWKSMKDALTFATKTAQGPESCPAILLEELCRSGYRLWREEVKSKSGTWDIDFLIVAIRLGFSAYVDERLKKLKKLPRGPDGSPLLCYALGSPVHELTNPLPPQPVFPSVVEVLLEHGADSNEEWSRAMPSGVSIWQRVLRFVHDEDTRSKIHGPDVLGDWARILKAMLRGGAKFDTTCDERHCVGVVGYEEFHSVEYQKIYAAQSHTVASVIRDSFSDQYPAEEAILLQMVSANKAVSQKRGKRKRRLSPERRGSKKAKRREVSKATNAIK